jgi:hypothetical protein
LSLVWSNLANSLASSENRAGDCDAPKGRATNRAMRPSPRQIPISFLEGMSSVAWWKPCLQSRLARKWPGDRKGSKPSMVGRCKGRGDIARLTPVMVGSKYGRTSVESDLWVQPNGLMVVTKDS